MCEWSRRRRGGETGSFSFGQRLSSSRLPRLSSSRLPRLSSSRLPRYSSRRDYHSSQFNWFAETDVVRFDWIVELLSTQSGIFCNLWTNAWTKTLFTGTNSWQWLPAPPPSVPSCCGDRRDLLWERPLTGGPWDLVGGWWWDLVGGWWVGGRHWGSVPTKRNCSHSAVARLNF